MVFVCITASHQAGAAVFPIVVPNWSGNTLLVVNESPRNVVAVPILKDGTLDTAHGVALAANASPFDHASNPDAIAATADGKFVYVHNEGSQEFFRFDMRNVQPGGTGHIQEFDFPDQSWTEDGMVVLGSFLYATATSCDTTCVASLYKMSIDALTGNLGSPTFVTDITDGTATASSSDSRLATDGTCIYASDTNTNVVFQICGTTVKVWADASSGGSSPDIDSSHTISFGPATANLFLSQSGAIYSTPGLIGITPGAFSSLGNNPDSGGTNEGSAFLQSPPVLFVGSENTSEVYAIRITGSGGSTALGTATTASSVGSTTGVTGDLIGFSAVEGLAILNGSPRFSSGSAFFTARVASGVPALSGTGLAVCAGLLLGIGFLTLRRRVVTPEPA